MLISIEGNIGTGKSTFVEILKLACNDKNIVFLKEPVDQWLSLIDSDGENILGKFYGDQTRWSYTFQMNAFITRCKLIMDTIKSHDKDTVIVMERSVLTDRHVFATLLKETGKISQMEWALYDQWFNWLTVEFKDVIPDIFFYLKADSNVSFERMRLRGRGEEKQIPIEYLESVSIKHDKWLIEESNCTTIDVNNDFQNNGEKREQMIQMIRDCISK